MSRKPDTSEEELIRELTGHNERAPARWRAHFEMERRAAEKAARSAGRATFWWTVVGAIAAAIAAVVGIIQLFR